MKKLILLIITAILFSCSIHDNKKDNFPLISEIFNEKEMNSLKQLLCFFDSVVNKSDQPIELAYIAFFRTMDSIDSYDPLVVNLSMDGSVKLKKLFAQLKEGGVYKEIWAPKNSNPRYSNILQIETRGKYIEFLKLLSNDNPFLKDYLEILRVMGGGGSPIITGNMLKEWYKEVDFSNEEIRLVWTVHYITVTSQEWL